MGVRDRIALALVCAAVLLALPLWWAGAGWVGVGVVLLGVAAAAVAYRVDPGGSAGERVAEDRQERHRS